MGSLRSFPTVAFTIVMAFAPTLAHGQLPGERAAFVERAASQKWAMLIGVDEYIHVNKLKYCGSDVSALQERLVGLGFPEAQTFLLHDGAKQRKNEPYKSNIDAVVETLLGKLSEDGKSLAQRGLVSRGDLVVVAFSGHGAHLDGTSYFCPIDARLNRADSLLSLERLYKLLALSPADVKLMLVDACRNDPRPGGVKDLKATAESKKLAESLDKPPQGILVLSSCAPGQVSVEDPELGHGVFMNYILDGLSGQADRTEGNRNDRVSLLELYRFASAKTKSHVAQKRRIAQTPELSGKIVGDFEFGRFGQARPALLKSPFTKQEAVAAQSSWSKTLKTPVELENSIGMKLALIPAGEFQMGSKFSAEEANRRYPGGKAEYYTNEHPRHAVRLTQPFHFGMHEVRVRDFERFVTATGYETTAEKEGSARGFTADGKWDDVDGLYWRKPGFEQSANHPVTCVSWLDAVAFCEWLSRKEGVTYRLPSEAEWEYACRGGTETVFLWGDDPDDGEGYLNAADLTGTPNGLAWLTSFDFRDGYAATAPVGSFKANPFSLYDIQGNVTEWCSDWYGNYPSGSVTDPTGPSTASYRVFRGGSWFSFAGLCRSAFRGGYAPTIRNFTLGFRVALVPSSE